MKKIMVASLLILLSNINSYGADESSEALLQASESKVYITQEQAAYDIKGIINNTLESHKQENPSDQSFCSKCILPVSHLYTTDKAYISTELGKPSELLTRRGRFGLLGIDYLSKEASRRIKKRLENELVLGEEVSICDGTFREVSHINGKKVFSFRQDEIAERLEFFYSKQLTLNNIVFIAKARALIEKSLEQYKANNPSDNSWITSEVVGGSTYAFNNQSGDRGCIYGLNEDEPDGIYISFEKAGFALFGSHCLSKGASKAIKTALKEKIQCDVQCGDVENCTELKLNDMYYTSHACLSGADGSQSMKKKSESKEEKKSEL